MDNEKKDPLILKKKQKRINRFYQNCYIYIQGNAKELGNGHRESKYC